MLPPRPMPPKFQNAMTAWDWMGGELNWAALHSIADILDVEDLDHFVIHLMTIREFVALLRAAKQREQRT
jgi:hypothetical protein